MSESNKQPSLVELYQAYTFNQESPWNFHFWGLVYAIGAICSRRVWIDQGKYKIYPNHYIIIVSPSAISRKGLSVEHSAELVYKTKLAVEERGLGGGFLTTVFGRLTNESLWLLIGDKEDDPDKDEFYGNPLAVFSGELSLTISQNQIKSGLVDTLLDLYTCPSTPRQNITKNAGSDFVTNACIHLFGATTPDWLGESFTPGVMKQGLAGRVIFVFGNGRKKSVPTPWVTKIEIDLLQQIQTRLVELAYLLGEVKLAPKARELYEYWYNNRKEPESYSATTGFFGREHDHTLKLAMILSLCESTSMVIEQRHFESALGYMMQVKQDIPKVFSEVRETHDIPITQMIENIIRDKKLITRSELTAKIYRKLESIEQLNEEIFKLRVAGQIEEIEELAEGKKKSVTWYKWRKEAVEY